MRTTLRMLARRPGFSLLAILTLALGITATTVVFSFAYGLLLSPLPYSNERRLTLLWEFDRTSRSDPGENLGPITTVPPQDLALWQRSTRTLERLDALTFGFYAIRQGASPTEVLGGRVTRGFFDTVGARPVLGRAFSAADPDDVAVLGYDLWQTQFGGDRAIVGKQVLLGDGSYTVIGVLPPQFFFYMREFALWTPLTLRSDGRRGRPVMGVGMLANRTTLAEAQAELDSLAARLDGNRGIRITTVRAEYSRFFGPTFGILLASVGFLLLIACANVASLLLARAAEREREMAIRVALGATRWQIVRQLLSESLAIAFLAGAAGVAMALLLVPVARTLLPLKLELPLPGVEAIAVSAPVVLFSSAISAITALLFGLAPALRTAAAALGARAISPGRAHRRFLDAIVVAELALSVLLLTGAGLTMRSVYALYHDTGFRADHLLTFRTPTAERSPERLVSFYRGVLDRLSGLPGVRAAAAAYGLPGGPGARSAVLAEGASPDPKDGAPAGVNLVSGDFFRTLDIPLLRGRTFSPRDGAGSPGVAILSEALARRLFAGADPIGRRVRIVGHALDQWLVVTGIAGDVRPLMSESVVPMLYRPYTQDPPGAIGFLIRTSGAPLGLAAAARKAVWQMRPGQPITYLGTLESDLDQQGFRQRLSAIGLGWFAALGLTLAAVGIYGLIAYVVKQRVREFGVRLAVGASPGDLVALVLRRGMTLIGGGLLTGAGASIVLTRLLRSRIYGIQGLDAATLIGASLVLAAAGLAACYLPARKAAAVDPIAVLRAE